MVSATWWQTDTMSVMAMTLRLTDQEQQALRERAVSEGRSMQDVARKAIRDYVARSAHRDNVAAATDLVLAAHADAIERLGR